MLAWETEQFNMLLSDILPDSIFWYSYDIYVSKVMYLRITWNNVNACGSAALTDFTVPRNLTTISLTNLSLNIYIQANPVIDQMTKEKFNWKQQLIYIPDIQANSISLSGTYQWSWVKVISNAYQASLYKTYN